MNVVHRGFTRDVLSGIIVALAVVNLEISEPYCRLERLVQNLGSTTVVGFLTEVLIGKLVPFNVLVDDFISVKVSLVISTSVTLKDFQEVVRILEKDVSPSISN